MPLSEKEKIMLKISYCRNNRIKLFMEEEKILEKHRNIVEQIGLTIEKEKDLRNRLKEIES